MSGKNTFTFYILYPPQTQNYFRVLMWVLNPTVQFIHTHLTSVTGQSATFLQVPLKFPRAPVSTLLASSAPPDTTHTLGVTCFLCWVSGSQQGWKNFLCQNPPPCHARWLGLAVGTLCSEQRLLERTEEKIKSRPWDSVSILSDYT